MHIISYNCPINCPRNHIIIIWFLGQFIRAIIWNSVHYLLHIGKYSVYNKTCSDSYCAMLLSWNKLQVFALNILLILVSFYPRVVIVLPRSRDDLIWIWPSFRNEDNLTYIIPASYDVTPSLISWLECCESFLLAWETVRVTSPSPTSFTMLLCL